MGFTLDAGGKPVYAPTPTQTVVDLQAGVDFSKKYAFNRAGTNSARTSIPAGELWDGLTFYETDTNSIYRYDGGWSLWERDWTAYTPGSISGFTGTFSLAKYKVHRGICTVKFRVAVATMTLNPTFSLPVAATDALLEHLPAGIALIPGSGSEAIGYVRKQSTSVIAIYCGLISGSSLYMGNISTSVPIAWGATGTIAGTFSYEVA